MSSSLKEEESKRESFGLAVALFFKSLRWSASQGEVENELIGLENPTRGLADDCCMWNNRELVESTS